jgi:DNA-binding transcriptional LysR family regulator
MDIVLLKTFLEVARTRHFGKAAEALCVTQSSVSARIKLLESTLGLELFSRKRNDIQLTPAGHRLQRHAETIVRSWTRVRQELALSGRFAKTLAIGAQADLWPAFVRDWVLALRRTRRDLALQAEILTAEALVQRLTTNQIDIAFLFEPPQLPGIILDQVARIPLVMVSDQPGLTAEAAMQRGYVLVDWGSTFMLSHSRHFPDLPASALRVSQGGMALDLVRRDGGSAYLARQMAGDALDRGELHLVADAPVIERQAYAVYKEDSENLEALGDLLRLGIRKSG